MRLITVNDLTEEVEGFIRRHRDDLPLSVGVQVLDMVVPGQALLLLMEKQPATFLATLAYATGVAFLRLAKHIDRRQQSVEARIPSAERAGQGEG